MFENGLTWVKADFHLHTHKDKEFRVYLKSGNMTNSEGFFA